MVGLLLPATLREQKMRKHMQKVGQALESQQNEITNLKSRLYKGGKGYDELLEKWNKSARELESKTNSYESLTKNFAAQKKTLDTIQSQSVDQITKLQQTKVELEQTVIEQQVAAAELQKELDLKNKELKKDQDKPEKKSAPRIDPHEFLKLKRKCRDYARLLKGSNGLRELSDARANNMQTAAAQLARHLHGSSVKELESVSEGQIIAQALEKVGGTFFVEPEEPKEVGK